MVSSAILLISGGPANSTSNFMRRRFMGAYIQNLMSGLYSLSWRSVFACLRVCMFVGLNMFVLVDSSLQSTPPVRMGVRSGRGLGCAAARRTAPTLPRVIEIEGR